MLTIHRPVDDPLVFVTVPAAILVSNWFQVVALLEVGIDVLIPVELTDNEIEGMNVFRSFVARCAECHTPPLFTNQQIAVIGVQEPEGHPFDEGAASVTGIPGLRGGFKIPSLRNVAKTSPYMHSGTFHELRDAARFYTLGRGHALPEEEKTRMIVHWHIWEPQLTDYELDRLVDFLGTLTDENFKPQIPQRVPSGLSPIGTIPDALGTN